MLAALAATSLAQAQVPAPQPAATVAIEGLAPGPFKLAPGDERVSAFQVRVNATGFACPQGSALVVALTANLARADGASVGVSLPAEVEVPVPAGPYLGEPAGTFSGSASAELRIRADAASREKVEPTVIVGASFAGGAPAGCAAPQPLPAAQAEARQTVFITPSAEDGGGPEGNETAPAEEPAAAPRPTPAPGLLLAAAAAVLVARLRRAAR
jgi:hypothetical protein